MSHRIFNISLLLLCLWVVPAQGFEYNKKNALPKFKVGLGIRLQPMEPYVPVALDIDIERRLGKGFYLGVVWGGGSAHVNNAFGYDTDNPVIKMFDFAPVIEYVAVCRDNFRLNLCLSAGISGVSLYDGNIYHYRKTSKIYDKDFSDDTYLAVKPGIVFYYGVGYIKFSYCLLQGRTTFATQNDFQGLHINIGISTFNM